MKITVTADNADHVLSDGTHGGLRLSPSSDTQVRRFLRGSFAKPEDRGNALLSIEFTVVQQHADVATASQHSLQRYMDVPRSGLVKFERMEGDIVIFQRYFQTAVVTLVGITPYGARTDEVWQITGGKLLTEEELV